jgi:hypothetical protein
MKNPMLSVTAVSIKDPGYLPDEWQAGEKRGSEAFCY